MSVTSLGGSDFQVHFDQLDPPAAPGLPRSFKGTIISKTGMPLGAEGKRVLGLILPILADAKAQLTPPGLARNRAVNLPSTRSTTDLVNAIGPYFKSVAVMPAARDDNREYFNAVTKALVDDLNRINANSAEDGADSLIVRT